MKNIIYSKFIKILTFLVIFFVIIELILRIINPGIISFAYNFRQIYKYNNRWGADFLPNSQCHVQLKNKNGDNIYNFLMTINKDGFRTYDRQLDNVSPDTIGKKYIFAIGDSFTMGWGLNYEACYPAKLDFMLPQDYRVLNLGLNAYGTIGATEKADLISKKYTPCMVIYLAYSNDYKDDELAFKHIHRNRLYYFSRDILYFLSRHCYVVSSPSALYWYSYFRKSIETNDSDFTYKKTYYQENTSVIDTVSVKKHSNPILGKYSKEALIAYSNKLKSQKIPFYVLLLEDEENMDDMHAFCKENSINSFQLIFPKEFKLIKDGHLNELGNFKLAQFIKSNIIDKTILINNGD
jgi:hypothetical protein